MVKIWVMKNRWGNKMIEMIEKNYNKRKRIFFVLNEKQQLKK